MRYEHITISPRQMGGGPCIKGSRIPVATVVQMVSEGMIEKDILKAYPDLTVQDIREALGYAAEAVAERQIPLLSAA